MHVVATAGHVDHGKSALVAALTGGRPDRLAEEQRRGLSIELGYVWTSWPDVGHVAFVDVPGHERFITTTLAGLGPVPAVLFVVAADDPWMPQAAEHLAALDGLGVAHAVLAVTRADLADPAPARERALAELGRTSLHGVRAVAVSARTGEGLTELREALTEMLGQLPVPDPGAAVRLWVDRSFTMTGAGSVVTGTLPAGRVAVGDRLATAAGTYRVRGVQSLGEPVAATDGTARVALNIVGEPPVERGDALVAPGAWHHTEVLDVRVSEVPLGTAALPPGTSPVPGAAMPTGTQPPGPQPPQRPMLHVGSATLPTHYRPLAPGLARLTLDRPVPLRIGDRALLRDPGTRRLWAATVLDPAPPPLRRRGAAQTRAAVLADHDGAARLVPEMARRGTASSDLLARLGVEVPAAPPAGIVTADGWLLSPHRAATAAREITAAVEEQARAAPLEPPLTLDALATRVGLPSPALVAAVAPPSLQLDAGRVSPRHVAAVPAPVSAAVAALRDDLDGRPFAAPATPRLAELGLDGEVQTAAVRAGLVLRPAAGVVLLAGADDAAAGLLAELPQPFNVSEARQRLGSSRRVVLPLLAHLDRTGRTRRLPDDRREVTGR
ncbi:SelB C-terminal domain-containing protein [Georgenia sp. MJ173]|uniref:SelB domain-containing protein n=1 Tax=Georgenia sunbinii TaxID=3117728 RepID=UPI002F2655DA